MPDAASSSACSKALATALSALTAYAVCSTLRIDHLLSYGPPDLSSDEATRTAPLALQGGFVCLDPHRRGAVPLKAEKLLVEHHWATIQINGGDKGLRHAVFVHFD